MIDINELRRLALDGDLAAMQEIILRLEAAEKERDALRAALQHEADCVEAAKAEIEALCAKVEAMVRQEPVAWARKLGLDVPSFGCVTDLKYRPSNIPESSYIPLYALPGAQNVPKAVAYLDLGVGGYMDIGTDLTDEELATLPKGRHMLGVIGTYGVDGYVPAQPAPSIPEGWKLVPIEPTSEMVKACASAASAYGNSPHVMWAAMLAAASEAKP